MRKVAFITGASSGIGYELALELARQGYVLALTARRETLLDELAENLRVPLSWRQSVVRC